MKLYVGNLSKQVTSPQLNELAAPFGKLVSAEVITERTSGTSKGFGFLEFSTDEEGSAAIKGLDGREIGGQKLSVSLARPKKERAQRY
jgi:cold-inducible RNA-binding protein